MSICQLSDVIKRRGSSYNSLKLQLIRDISRHLVNAAFVVPLVGCWHDYVSGSRCRFAYGPADATASHYLFLQ